jgi:hypothetical protein
MEIYKHSNAPDNKIIINLIKAIKETATATP